MITVFELPEVAFPIKVEQHANGRFRVTYGKQIKSGLGYGEAAYELGSVIFHALACDGKLDNRSLSEIAADGGISVEVVR